MTSIISDPDFTIERIYLPDPIDLGEYAKESNRDKPWYGEIIKYWTDYKAILSAAAERSVPVTCLTTDSHFSVGDARCEVLWQGRDLTPWQFSDWAGNYMNNFSLVTMIHCSGVRVLTAGDIQFTTERALRATSIDLHADIMKLSHHAWGATANSQAFMNRVDPDLVWWENERDTPEGYGDEGIERQMSYLHSGAEGLSVRHNGTFTITVQDGTWSWQAERNDAYHVP